ncbi:hypothetical protein [Variovorax sp. DXTD-1]|uniref:hypothetical protein n=1 Tax=Variovorax sp. DXTD-1 TaxID=2495592 RepID=UPI000F87E836|nr:hypothetical protein [Variovorax sp. DXTD-1]RST51129.1 hypothetical protein EJI00_09425 [Variovorax sp. DXTD-1]
MTGSGVFQFACGTRFSSGSVAFQIERPSKRRTMKSLVHTSRTARRQKPAETRSLWARISRSLARLDGTRRANEERVLEQMRQLERLDRMDFDQRVRETGEW